jgi:GNAT superfamily N-acetyltransferase
MGKPVEVRAVASRSDLDRFIKLPWQIYRDDPLWVAPLIADVRRVMDRNKHPFHQHADVEYFLAWRDGAVVGRIAAVVNRAHNDFHEDRLGFFGLFETIDDQTVAHALLARAEQWLRERGRDAVRGPFNLSSNDELCSGGVLVDGFEHPPQVLMTHTPRYYGPLLEQAGYSKEKDLLAYWLASEVVPERFMRALNRIKKSEEITVRSLRKDDFRGEVDRIKEIYNSAWEKNWGFIPMTEAEFEDMARQMKPILDPDLCQLAEVRGEAIAFILELPDLNQAFKHMNGRLFPFGIFKFLWYRRKIKQVRVITLGVKPAYRLKGLESVLMGQLFDVNVSHGVTSGECSWILEDNLPMLHALDRVGGYRYKTYRVYQKPLSA